MKIARGSENGTGETGSKNGTGSENERPQQTGARQMKTIESEMPFTIKNKANEPKFRIGDVVTIRDDATPKPGQFVLACVGGEFVFRRYVPAKADTHVGARLRAENAMFPEIVMNQDDTIMGVMGRHTSFSHD